MKVIFKRMRNDAEARPSKSRGRSLVRGALTVIVVLLSALGVGIIGAWIITESLSRLPDEEVLAGAHPKKATVTHAVTTIARIEPAQPTIVAVKQSGQKPAGQKPAVVAPPRSEPARTAEPAQKTVPAVVSAKKKEPLLISFTPVRYDEKGNEIVVEPAFKTEMEIGLSVLLSTPPGVEPIPLFPPDNDEDGSGVAEVQKTLANVIDITPEDSEDLAQHKINVGWAKLDMAEFIKQGYSAKDYTATLFETMNDDLRVRRQLIEYIDQVAKTKSAKAAMIALQDANEYLKTNEKPLIDKGEIFEDEAEE
jgi:hypothetical protein